MSPPSEEKSTINEETREIEEVINAFLYYGKYGTETVLRMIKQTTRIPREHQILISGRFKEHLIKLRERIDHNHTILKIIANNAEEMFGENYVKAMRIHQTRRPKGDYASRILSTMRQICREWSSEGLAERESTFQPIIGELNSIYPSKTQRHEVRVMVPGCGLGRLAHDLIDEGYTVQGNEFSYFMLITSFFILNSCKQANEFTIYPFIFERDNSWSYEDQLRAVTFPDKSTSSSEVSRLNGFSMCAGDFLGSIQDSEFDAIVTAWFIDTAHNVMDYIDAIYKALPIGGIWINVGPLTWHYKDTGGENSIELPYSEVMRLIRLKGFEVMKERRIDSKYVGNRLSMLHNQYTCAYFYARKVGQQPL